MSASQDVEMVQGESISLSITDENIFINTAEVLEADRIGSNGVVHVIDEVIIPPSYAE